MNFFSPRSAFWYAVSFPVCLFCGLVAGICAGTLYGLIMTIDSTFFLLSQLADSKQPKCTQLSNYLEVLHSEPKES